MGEEVSEYSEQELEEMQVITVEVEAEVHLMQVLQEQEPKASSSLPIRQAEGIKLLT